MRCCSSVNCTRNQAIGAPPGATGYSEPPPLAFSKRVTRFLTLWNVSVRTARGIVRLGDRPTHPGPHQVQRLIPNREREEPVHHPRGREGPASTQGLQQPGG